MSTVYNPESETIAQIERLELEAREVRRRIERSRSDEDRRALNRQLEEVQRRIGVLRARVP
jgi:urease accessory protein UreE